MPVLTMWLQNITFGNPIIYMTYDNLLERKQTKFLYTPPTQDNGAKSHKCGNARKLQKEANWSELTELSWYGATSITLKGRLRMAGRRRRSDTQSGRQSAKMSTTSRWRRIEIFMTIYRKSKLFVFTPTWVNWWAGVWVTEWFVAYSLRHAMFKMCFFFFFLWKLYKILL